MDLQVQFREHQPAYPKNKKTNKMTQNHHYYKYDYNSAVSNSNQKRFTQYPVQNSYSQHKHTSYPSWDIFEGNNSHNKGNMTQGFNKFESQQNHLSYAKTSHHISYSSDKAGRSTGPSDNDSGNTFSELAGFKILRNGKVLYDETEEDFGFSDNETNEVHKAKFASSVMMIGPTTEISIPSFAETD